MKRKIFIYSNLSLSILFIFLSLQADWEGQALLGLVSTALTLPIGYLFSKSFPHFLDFVFGKEAGVGMMSLTSTLIFYLGIFSVNVLQWLIVWPLLRSKWSNFRKN